MHINQELNMKARVYDFAVAVTVISERGGAGNGYGHRAQWLGPSPPYTYEAAPGGICWPFRKHSRIAGERERHDS